MDNNSFPIISYAECVKTSSNDSKQMNSHTAPMSWYEQVESYQNGIMSQLNSIPTILSDDAAINSSEHSTIAMHRLYSISHSMDSDLSSDNEQYQKSSVTQAECADDVDAVAATTSSTKNINTSIRQRKNVHHKQQMRRESVDSGVTSSSSCCADPDCNRDHNQLSLMCQRRWKSAAVAAKIAPKFEYDEEVLTRRQKQIDYGKSTIGYELYSAQVPREKRTRDHPQTPDKTRNYSRRAFDGLIRIWRQQLHKFDPFDSYESTETEWQTVMAKRH